MLKKRVKQLTQDTSADTDSIVGGALIAHPNNNNRDTFLTACLTKNGEKQEEEESKEEAFTRSLADDSDERWRTKQYYKYPEDELLD